MTRSQLHHKSLLKVAANITNDPGDYRGIYGSIGLATDFGERWQAGPELIFLAVEREQTDDFLFLVQLNWRLDSWF